MVIDKSGKMFEDRRKKDRPIKDDRRAENIDTSKKIKNDKK